MSLSYIGKEIFIRHRHDFFRRDNRVSFFIYNGASGMDRDLNVCRETMTYFIAYMGLYFFAVGVMVESKSRQ